MGEEQPLAGGVNPSPGVVRVGDTVGRPAGRSAPAVRCLLLHLEAVGFDAAPRFLGTDEKGRDVLSYVAGDVPLPPYRPERAEELVDVIAQELAQLLGHVRGGAAAGTEPWATLRRETGGEGPAAADDLWQRRRQRRALVHAMTRG